MPAEVAAVVDHKVNAAAEALDGRASTAGSDWSPIITVFSGSTRSRQAGSMSMPTMRAFGPKYFRQISSDPPRLTPSSRMRNGALAAGAAQNGARRFRDSGAIFARCGPCARRTLRRARRLAGQTCVRRVATCPRHLLGRSGAPFRACDRSHSGPCVRRRNSCGGFPSMTRGSGRRGACPKLNVGPLPPVAGPRQCPLRRWPRHPGDSVRAGRGAGDRYLIEAMPRTTRTTMTSEASRQVDVLIAGAGFAGLSLAIALRQALGASFR